MDTLFLIIFLLSFIATPLFGVLAIIQYIKKDSIKGKQLLKRTGISLAVMVLSLIAFSATTDSVETVSEEESEAAVSEEKEEASTTKEEEKSKEVEETAEEKAAREAEEAKAKEEAAAKKLEEEKTYYLNNVKTKVDSQMSRYDEIWNTLWTPTFEGVSNGTVDIYTAYSNMKSIENQYNALYSSLGEIPEEGLSKENKELLAEFKSKMKSAALWRGNAAEKAQEMFDEGDYSPSSLEDMKTDISYADSEMISAVVSLTSLEMDLGVERE